MGLHLPDNFQHRHPKDHACRSSTVGSGEVWDLILPDLPTIFHLRWFKILFFWSIGSFLFPNLFPGKLFSDQEPFFSGLDLNLAFTFFNIDSTSEARQGL